MDKKKDALWALGYLHSLACETAHGSACPVLLEEARSSIAAALAPQGEHDTYGYAAGETEYRKQGEQEPMKQFGLNTGGGAWGAAEGKTLWFASEEARDMAFDAAHPMDCPRKVERVRPQPATIPERLTPESAQQIKPSWDFTTDNERYSWVDGWNACRKAMLAAATKAEG